jgi:hypothetical protein
LTRNSTVSNAQERQQVLARLFELPKALEYVVGPMPQILKFAAVMQLHALMLRYARHATDRLGD